MKKAVCLVFMRMVPKGGSKFRVWLATRVCRFALDQDTWDMRRERWVLRHWRTTYAATRHDWVCQRVRHIVGKFRWWEREHAKTLRLTCDTKGNAMKWRWVVKNTGWKTPLVKRIK